MASSSLDPVVVGALISIREHKTIPPMNRGDLKRVGLTFRRLVRSGINYHPDVIRDLLLNDGWTEKMAIKVSDIANYEQITANEQDYPRATINRWRETGLKASNE